MARAWGSDAKPLLAGGTLDGTTGFGVPSPTSRAERTWGRQTFVSACSNHLKILDVSPIGLKILYLISSSVIYSSR